MTTARIKVSVSKLIALIEEKKAEAIAAFDAKKLSAEAAAEAHVGAVRQAIYEAHYHSPVSELVVRRLQVGGKGRYCVVLPIEVDKVETPVLNTSQFDKDIAMLRLASEDTITISHDTDLGRMYL